MKGDLTLRVLEVAKEMSLDLSDLFAVLLSSGYGASYSKLQYGLEKRRYQRYKSVSKDSPERRLKDQYYTLIYKLKKDDLIRLNVRNGKKIVALTKKGEGKLGLLRLRKKNALPSPRYSESSFRGEGNKFTIISFDIPEKERRKRAWLRSVLGNLGFKMIQKSVWLGKVKIPKDFLEDLLKLKLIDFVEIFEITKTGSLKHIA